MKKLLTLILLAAGMAHGQTYNVAITNSLLGPVNLDFTGTVIQATGSTVITGAVVNTAITNTINSTLILTNEITVGAVSVSNNVNNTVSVTNIIENVAFSATNLITINDPTTFATATHTSTPQSVRIYGGTNLATSVVAGANMDIYVDGGGGSGNITINSLTSNVFTFVGTNGIIIRTTNNTIQIGQTTIPDSFIGTNRVTYQYSGGDQTFTVPAGITNIAIWAWGGGGSAPTTDAAGIGGHSFNVLNTFGGEQFRITVGQGGLSEIFTNVPTYGSAAFGGGGRGYTTSAALRVYSGAGGSWVRRLTDSNIVIAAGGTGGTTLPSGSGQAYGGGLTGGEGRTTTTSLAGLGGSRTNGGSGAWAQTSVTDAIVLPTSGSFLQGGDGGVRTGTVTTASGGGGGYYGGGGNLAGNSASTSAGGGSGFDGVGVGGVVFGSTYRQTSGISSQVPIGQDLPFYVSGVATRAASATANGGNGQVTIGY